MPQAGAATLDLPPELWMYIHRLATSNLSPLATVYSARDASPEESEAQLSSFLKAVSSLGRVCRLWKDLTQELLYENIRITEWPSLSAALDRPELARRVRSIRLSTRNDDSVIALRRCPQVEVILQPLCQTASAIVEADFELPPLPSLKRLYWTQGPGPCTLLQNVLRAAPNLDHLSFSAVSNIGSPAIALELPSRPASVSLAGLGDWWLTGLLRADFSRLSYLAIDCTCRSLLNTPLPALQHLDLTVDLSDKLIMFSPASLSTILRSCPSLREIRYNAGLPPVAPEPQQVASALACVRLVLPRLDSRTRLLGIPDNLRQAIVTALEQLLGSAFPALERIVIDGPGWEMIDWENWNSVVAHRQRGRRVECEPD
ncbi:hypothetical protein C8R46DRAFT_1353317 [Mycena filopes]|nr:hypothetical protein C8R46DRAFT_1353317 [Mycena filopes]